MDARNLSAKSDARAQAEHWHARLRADDCTGAEREAFEEWRTSNPSHDAAYREIDRLWDRSAELRFDPAIRAATQAAVRNQSPRASASEASMTSRGESRRPTAAARSKWLPTAVAAALLTAIALGVLLRLSEQSVATQHFATRVGERQTLTLADRSTVLLDADSSIAVVYSGSERRVSLEKGRAQFTVASNPNRPFVVEAVNGHVRALGTQFQVALAPRSVTVTLFEGAVSVDALARSATLAPGEELTFEPSGTLWSKQAADLEVARGWTEGTLVFKSRSLPDLIDEMNRYATRTRLRIADPSLRAVTVSGRFRADDQQTFLLALEQGWSVRAERVSDDEIVLSRGAAK